MRRALLPALLLAGVLAPAAAHAEDIYVSAASTREAGSCPVITPCTLKAGIAAADQPGDVVRVGRGSYTLSQPTEIADGVTVVAIGGARPVITGNLRTDPIGGATPTRLERLELHGSLELGGNAAGVDLVVRNAALGVGLSGGELHQSLVVATGDKAVGVLANRGATKLTGSTVIAEGPGARGVVAAVYAYQGECLYSPTELVLEVRDVIARGPAGDLVATGSASGGCADTAAMTVSHSNYRTALVPTQKASIAQGQGNQTTPALTDFAAIFADTALYRQKDAAPTRNAGVGDAPAAATDLDGHGRVQEGRVDIGADELPAPPRAVTQGATDVGQNGATLQALVTPNGAETLVVFDYGTTDAYGSSTAPQALPAGGEAAALQARVDGLAPGTTFHYRVRAYNPPEGVQPQGAAGAGSVFATLAPPSFPPPGVAPPVVAPPPTALPVILTALTAKKSLKLATFRRRGLKVGFLLGRPGTAYAAKLTARLRVRGRMRTVTLARVRGTAEPGTQSVTLKPSRKTVALLRGVRRAKARLVVTAKPAVGAESARSRSVTLSR